MFEKFSLVYVPHPRENHWDSWCCMITDISDDGYTVTPYGLNDSWQENTWNVFNKRESCECYIKTHYYDGLCRGCKYDNVECNWTCRYCNKNKSGICELNGVTVTNNKGGAYEICKYYEPKLPQDIRDYKGFDWYLDLMKNCLYNQECDCHKYSIWRTCSYERWTNIPVRIDMKDKNTSYNSRPIISCSIKTKDWFTNTFKKENKMFVYGITYAPLRTKTGKIKKGTYNFGESFRDGIWITIGKDNVEEDE